MIEEVIEICYGGGCWIVITRLTIEVALVTYQWTYQNSKKSPVWVCYRWQVKGTNELPSRWLRHLTISARFHRPMRHALGRIVIQCLNSAAVGLTGPTKHCVVGFH